MGGTVQYRAAIYAARAASIVSAVIGVVALIGWYTNIQGLRAWVPNGATIKINTAVLIILIAAAFFLDGRQRSNAVKCASACLAALVAIIAGLTVSQDAFGYTLGIDAWLSHDPSGSGRMSPITAANFIGLGVGLLLTQQRRNILVAGAIFFVVLASASAAAIGLLIYSEQGSTETFFGGPAVGTITVHLLLALTGISSVWRDFGELPARLSAQRIITIAPVLLLTAIALLIATYIASVRLDRYAEQSLRLRSGALETVVTLQDAERGQRGYLITHDEAYLDPYRDAKAKFSGRMSVLTGAARGNPDTMLRIAAIQQTVTQKMAELEQTVELATAGNFSAAQEIIESGRGRQLMLSLRSDVNTIIDNENAALAALRGKNERLQFLTLVFSIFAGLATLIMIFAARRGAKLEIEALTGAQAQLRVANEQLEGRVTQRTSELQQSEAKFREVFEFAGLGIALVGLDGRWLKVNPQLRGILGYGEQELQTLTFQDLTFAEDLPACMRRLDDLVSGKTDTFTVVKRYIRPDKSLIWANVTTSLAKKADGSPDHLITIIEDYSARMKMEAALKDSEARFREVFEYGGIGIALVDIGGRWLRVNDPLCSLLGYDRSELTRLTWQEITFADDLKADEAFVEDLLAGRLETYSMLKRYIRKDRSLVWANLTVTLAKGDDGAPDHFISFIEDYSERIATENALKASEAEYRFLANAMPQLVWTSDGAGNVVYYNKRRELYYPAPQNVKDGEKEWHALIHPDDFDKTVKAWHAAQTPGSAYQMEHRLRLANGAYAWHLSRAVALRDDAGSVIKWYGTATDIDDAKQREQHIRVLMGEVSHRSKNLLAVSQAIVRQTAASAKNVVDFADHFSGRLGGLAASQDILIRENWAGAPLDGLIRSQLGHYRDLIGNRIRVSGETLLLEPAAAQAIGMALHELSTNAAKYGALSVSEGNIEIEWSTDDDHLLMTWCEKNGPPVVAPTRKGFGQIVMQKMLTQRLGGTVQLDYRPEGIIWRLRVPLDAVQSGRHPVQQKIQNS